ncbi:dephospho-CoA kinase [Plantibacter sp. YIM 135347]|jgi:dephospho-CoA kinase|uniref:dephospho-CoA kinase n=1 Tax=Plantibacter sp. YIM 135347 TaxID=3423919 RepID=UPI003D334D05
MYLIGLTGGIASGKSTIARRLESLGAIVIDADVISREVVEPGTPGLQAIVERFGPELLDADGALVRARLGAIVFSDPAALADLNAIVHPAVKRRSHELIEAASAVPGAVVVYDVPLLVETGRADEFDRVVVAHAPDETRLERLTGIRGLDAGEAQRRISAQATDEQRLAVADDVVDTDGTMEHTLEQVDRIWEAAFAASRQESTRR